MTENFGRRAADVVTGFEGIVGGYCLYMTGCNQVLLQGRSKDGASTPDSIWVDEARVKLMPGGPIKLNEDVTTRGFGPPAPLR